jgi:1,4-dihydroxy-2-naphthoate octaprenyltransferase
MNTDTIGQPEPVRHITVGKLLRAMRLFSIPASVLPVFAATAAILPVLKWRWDVLAASVLGVALLHLAGNLFNDYFDFASGVDRRTEDDEFRPGRLLVYRELLPRDVLLEALVCLLLGGAATAYLVWRCGPEMLWFAGAAVVAIYVYTGPPFRLKYRALGEVVIFLVFGPFLLVGAAWAQTGRFEMVALVLSIPVGLATTAILVGGNFRDREEDGAAGIRTIGRLAGGRVVRVAYFAAVLGSVLGLAGVAAAGFGPWTLALAPLTLALLGRPLACVWRNRRLPDIDAQTARWEAVMLVLVIVAYLI